MSKFRITPARRDFLRIVSNHGSIEVDFSRGRLVNYWVPGQLSYKMSSSRFRKFITNGYLKEVSIEAGKVRFKPTKKAMEVASI